MHMHFSVIHITYALQRICILALVAWYESEKEFTKLVDRLWEKPHLKRKYHGNYWPLQSSLVWQKDNA